MQLELAVMSWVIFDFKFQEVEFAQHQFIFTWKWYIYLGKPLQVPKENKIPRSCCIIVYDSDSWHSTYCLQITCIPVVMLHDQWLEEQRNKVWFMDISAEDWVAT